MKRFSDQPIKNKLLMLFAATSLSALTVACGGFWVHEIIAYKETLLRESHSIAAMLGQNSTAAITFGDRSTASEMLSGLRAEPRIARACIYDKQDAILAQYSTGQWSFDCPLPAHRAQSAFSLRFLTIHSPILLDGENIGELVMCVSLDDMYVQMARFAGAVLILLAAAALVSFLLSTRWQKMISGPILHLTEVADKVSSRRDYSIRAVAKTRDELGVLIAQFNHMLEEIHKRDGELQEHRDRLELRVVERTHELEAEIAERKAIEKDLIKARIAAEASNKAKSEFLANMSHELRTPLTAIIGYSEMLEEDVVAQNNQEAASDLQRIQSAGRHLLSLVNDILDLAKIEAGKADLHMDWVPISAIVHKVEETVTPLSQKRDNIFSVDCDPRCERIYTDSTKLFQVLINLLSNACKFTENGKISLTIEPEGEGTAARILWKIQDTGIGIAEADLAKLFKPFSQVDTTAARKFGGTGLGLDISQRLSHMLGGTIEVKSKLGEGTLFIVSLPAGMPVDSGPEDAPAPSVSRVA
jgi:signal transduction histidine kinase